MGTRRSIMNELGTPQAPHWGQWHGGVGRETEWRQRPEAGPGRGRSKSAGWPVGVLLLVVSLGLFSFVPDATASGDHGCKKVAITPLDTPVDGNAFLCSDAHGVRAWLYGKGFKPGDAYTVWLFYWDDPSQCATPGQCGLADGPTPVPCGGPLIPSNFNPLVVIGRLDSAVAPRHGALYFAGQVRGMRLSSGSQVWLFIGAHGKADASDNRVRARQLLTPEDPPLGVPHLGNCVDGPRSGSAAIAIFNIP
jgi:hypothetical protein